MAKFFECPGCECQVEGDLETGLCKCQDCGREFTIAENPYPVAWSTPHYPPGV